MLISGIIRAYDRYLKYVVEAMKKDLLKQSILHADETPFEVNKDDRGPGSKSYMWVYCGGVEENASNIVVYNYLTYLLTKLSKTMQDLNTEIPERLFPWSKELPDHVRKPDNTL